ncbi:MULTISPECIES: CobW family GTP-binding protein [Pseudomonadati]|uniref:GTP-binding protein n=1 Tax=Shewanella aestuarii TaxID=1028752 RepID=A0ABT0L270_9GAMM|nr:GTP-binding protein [Shewanella aestuarii]MCL1117804.1 GTP-binding protein [Shewanella aestuarii]GGN77137.1 cobalamin biosynthesis protein CobW [Shewanella aestuarii]
MIINPVKTNIITGFLGVGKTSLIKQLLSHKPEHEVWAVLVNEFGEIGIDAGLINGANHTGVVIKEVAGGCLCCAAGVPIQVAINQIIQRAKPDRLLIEPTGIGHPQEIIKVLSAPHYAQVINLQASVCLVDARKLALQSYRDHDTYRQQLLIADLIVTSKTELYQHNELVDLQDFLSQLVISPRVLQGGNYFLSDDFINEILASLNTPARKKTSTVNTSQHSSAPTSLLNRATSESSMWFNQIDEAPTPVLMEGEIICKLNQGDGCYSIGWLISPSMTFNFDLLMRWVETFKRPDIIRLKAVMITFDGILGINMVDSTLHLSELDEAVDSRLEIITEHSLNSAELQQSLIACIDE